MQNLRQFVGFIAIAVLGALLGTSVYETVVLVPNFNHAIPDSLEHFRLFMTQANPGTFFRVVAPVSQVALLVCVILNWKRPSSRWPYVMALVILVATDVVTFTFHYPRNDFLFTTPLAQPVPELVQAAHEWGMGNLARIALMVVSTSAAALGLRATTSWPARAL